MEDHTKATTVHIPGEVGPIHAQAVGNKLDETHNMFRVRHNPGPVKVGAGYVD